MGNIIWLIVAIGALFIFVKFLSWPLKILWKLLVNSVLGAVLLFIVNAIGGYFNFYLGINAITVLIAGFFGIPGVIFLIIFKLFF